MLCGPRLEAELVAGSAAPGAEVSVLLDGEAQPVASADSIFSIRLIIGIKKL